VEAQYDILREQIEAGQIGDNFGSVLNSVLLAKYKRKSPGLWPGLYEHGFCL
jgi:hypothetical protein